MDKKRKPKTAKKKVQLKDLKAKKASQIKGGLSIPRAISGESRDDKHKGEIEVESF